MPQKRIFFIQTSTLIPCSVKTIRYISKVQKHGTELVTWLHFLFYNFSSKPHCWPYKEADLKAVKVVNFATKWLNLYPHTVISLKLMFPTNLTSISSAYVVARTQKLHAQFRCTWHWKPNSIPTYIPPQSDIIDTFC